MYNNLYNKLHNNAYINTLKLQALSYVNLTVISYVIPNNMPKILTIVLTMVVPKTGCFDKKPDYKAKAPLR